MEADYTLSKHDQNCRCSLSEIVPTMILKKGVRTIFIENQANMYPDYDGRIYGSRFGFCPVHNKEVAFTKEQMTNYERGWTVKTTKLKDGLLITYTPPPDIVTIKEWSIPAGYLVTQIKVTGVSAKVVESPHAKIASVIHINALRFDGLGDRGGRGKKTKLRVYIKDGLIVDKKNQPIEFMNPNMVYEALGLHDPSSLQSEASC